MSTQYKSRPRTELRPPGPRRVLAVLAVVVVAVALWLGRGRIAEIAARLSVGDIVRALGVLLLVLGAFAAVRRMTSTAPYRTGRDHPPRPPASHPPRPSPPAVPASPPRLSPPAAPAPLPRPSPHAAPASPPLAPSIPAAADGPRLPEPLPPPRSFAPEPPTEVLLSASAPRGAEPGCSFVARLAAYVPALRVSTAELLERLDPEAETYLDLRECRWTYGARVVVRLHAAGLAVTPAEQSFVWRGTRDLVDFQVDVPEEGAPARTVLRFEVVLAGFVVATIALPLAVGAAVPEGGRALETATPTRKWFASHARRDRRRVLDRVAALRSAMRDVEIFIDRSLLPGERWRRRIEEEIAACETFLLFWSPRAKRSRWVAWEWKLALEKKGIDRFQLHPLAYAPPPPELAELQVEDETNDLRDAEGWLLSAWRRVAALVP